MCKLILKTRAIVIHCLGFYFGGLTILKINNNSKKVILFPLISGRWNYHGKAAP